MRWNAAVKATAAGAVAAARAGSPTVLDVQGDGGFGKSSFVRDVLHGLSDARVLRSRGYETTRDQAYTALRDWGVELGTRGVNPLSAARALAEQLDAHHDALVVLVLDDLHWADRESIETLAMLLDRAEGDRLLVITAHRPTGTRHALWADRLADVASVRRVVLTGLDEPELVALVTELSAAPPPALASALLRHTGGSPLFVRSLLREYDVDQLAALEARGALPAPSDLAEQLQESLDHLDPRAASLLRALAVLGGDWSELATVAAVAGVEASSDALTTLVRGGLVNVDRRAALPRVKIFHAVVSAAVYDRIPDEVRRRLHRAAAARLGEPGDRLRHRAAASERPDAGLAGDLEAFARTLHESALLRQAARFLRLAAQLSTDPDEARRRALDADFELVLAHDIDEVQVDGSSFDTDPRFRLVVAGRWSVEKRWVDAAALLRKVTDDEVAALDALTAYRVLVLRAWSSVGAGRPPLETMRDLQAAQALPVADAALTGHLRFAAGQAGQGALDQSQWMTVDGLLSRDRAQLASTPAGMVELAWRGGVMSLTGMPREAIGDLTVVTRHFSSGMVDFSDGMFHALLGFAQFIGGAWPRAAISIELSRAGTLGAAHPLAAAIAPLAAIVDGNADEVRRLAAEARAARVRGPLLAAVHAGDVVEVLALAYLGTDASRSSWRAGRIVDLGEPVGCDRHPGTASLVPRAVARCGVGGRRRRC